MCDGVVPRLHLTGLYPRVEIRLSPGRAETLENPLFMRPGGVAQATTDASSRAVQTARSIPKLLAEQAANAFRHIAQPAAAASSTSGKVTAKLSCNRPGKAGFKLAQDSLHGHASLVFRNAGALRHLLYDLVHGSSFVR
jgi:hypothetical protein